MRPFPRTFPLLSERLPEFLENQACQGSRGKIFSWPLTDRHDEQIHGVVPGRNCGALTPIET